MLLPSYGESTSLGFFLKDLGYYLSLNEYSDLNLTSDIYSKGSFGLKSNYRYKKGISTAEILTLALAI